LVAYTFLPWAAWALDYTQVVKLSNLNTKY
jgi:hypothetical protein